MTRFWPSTVVPCFAVFLFGCGGRSIEGQWHGPLPGIASNETCRMRLFGNLRFEYSCPKSMNAGIGRYTFDGNWLEMWFEKNVTSGRLEESAIPTYRAKVSGPGNELRLTMDVGDAVVWKRTKL